eukprot:15351175-Ditylum_brightwellii.AAC.1
MAYQRFTNLRERFRGDLLLKIKADMESLNFMDQPCNCNRASQVNRQCAYQARMTEHFADVVRLTSTTKPALPEDDTRRSDTFAKHFAKHFPRDTTAQQLHENIDLDILWQ